VGVLRHALTTCRYSDKALHPNATATEIAAHMRDASLADFGDQRRAKPVPPERDGLMADVNPALASRSSTLRSESGYRTYIITTRRITSGELLKYRNGLLIA